MRCTHLVNAGSSLLPEARSSGDANQCSPAKTSGAVPMYTGWKASPGMELRWCWTDGIPLAAKAVKTDGSFLHPLSRFKWGTSENYGSSWSLCWMTSNASISETLVSTWSFVIWLQIFFFDRVLWTGRKAPGLLSGHWWVQACRQILGPSASPCPGGQKGLDPQSGPEPLVLPRLPVVRPSLSPTGSGVSASPHTDIPAASNRLLSGKRVSSLVCRLIKNKTPPKVV